MTFKLIGSLLIVIGCGGFGFITAINYKREENILKQFIRVLDYISCELQYRQTPLPQLCRQASMECNGILNKIFLSFSEELDKQISANAQHCMLATLTRYDNIPKQVHELLLLFSQTVGKFDLEGQLQELNSLRQECNCRLDQFAQNKDSRVRTYQTLGLCAGAALAILLI